MQMFFRDIYLSIEMHIREFLFESINYTHFEYFECITLSSFYDLWRVGNEAKGRNGGE